MSRLVEIQYNPYVPKLLILINGDVPSKFSAIGRYYNLDIWDWGASFINDLNHEINDSFYVRFEGNEEDFEVLRMLLQEDDYCVGIEFTRVNLAGGTTQERLIRLNNLYKKNNKKCTIIIRSTLVIDDDLSEYTSELESVSIINRFCRVVQRVVKYSDYNNEIEPESNLFIITKGDDITRLNKFDSKYPRHIISLNRKENAVSLKHRCYLYSSSFDGIVDTLFEGYLRYPLLIALRKGTRILSESDIDTSSITEIVEPIKIEIGKPVNCGESVPIKYSCRNGTIDLSMINIRVLDETIAYSDKLSIFGKHIGSTILEAYRKGEFSPFYTERIIVTEAKRVKQLILDNNRLVIGIGKSYLIKVNCYPIEAQNISLLKWKSSDENVAFVDHRGYVTGILEGKCDIFCSVENISSKCEVTVLPFLKDISILSPDVKNDDYLEMEPFEEIQLNIKRIPENAIDGQIVINTSDMDIVNIVNNCLIAKKRGVAIITIMNGTQTCKKTIRIKVVKRLFFNKKTTK